MLTMTHIDGGFTSGLSSRLFCLVLCSCCTMPVKTFKPTCIRFGFDFLQVNAGFNISWSLIPYDSRSNEVYWRVFFVGNLLITLILSFCVICGR